MRHFVFTTGILLGVQACAAAPGYTVLTATLPGEVEALDRIEEGQPVRLDLILRPPLVPAIRQAGAEDPAQADCTFGSVPAVSVSLPTGSDHLLMEAALGEAAGGASGLLTCEYDPSLLGSDVPGVWRLRGCFLPRAVSVPTALSWNLAPLAPAACGIGN